MCQVKDYNILPDTNVELIVEESLALCVLVFYKAKNVWDGIFSKTLCNNSPYSSVFMLVPYGNLLLDHLEFVFCPLLLTVVVGL